MNNEIMNFNDILFKQLKQISLLSDETSHFVGFSFLWFLETLIFNNTKN